MLAPLLRDINASVEQVWRRYFHCHLIRLLWGPLRNQNCLEKERIIGAREGTKEFELQTIVERQKHFKR